MHAEPFVTAEPFESAPARSWPDAAAAAPHAVPAWLHAFVMEAVRVAAPPAYLRWIRAAVGGSVRLLDVDQVLFFQSDSKCTLVQTAAAQAVIRMSLSDLRRELDPAVWWTIHRSTIVNVRAIDEVRRQGDGRVVVQLKGHARTLRVSEAHERQFRQM